MALSLAITRPSLLRASLCSTTAKQVCFATAQAGAGKAPTKSQAKTKSVKAATPEPRITRNVAYSPSYECPEYHNFNEYSYYDIENGLLQYRLSQPDRDGWHLKAKA